MLFRKHYKQLTSNLLLIECKCLPINYNQSSTQTRTYNNQNHKTTQIQKTSSQYKKLNQTDRCICFRLKNTQRNSQYCIYVCINNMCHIFHAANARQQMRNFQYTYNLHSHVYMCECKLYVYHLPCSQRTPMYG